MPDDIILKVEHVSKKFCRKIKHVMLYGAKDIACSMIGLSSNSERLRNGEFWAVDDVSFELRRGETLGLIGPNGSGKSTILKMINGIFMPDKGIVKIKGRMSALIEVSAGFHPMLTGRENIYINGAIIGMNKSEIDNKFDEIVDFAEIGEFIDSPVKHYSSGMYVRLGFAVAVHTDPDILLIDEVLSVGDINYRMKCIEKIKEFQKTGKAIIFVSHEMSTVKKICQRCIWNQDGKIREIGDSNQIVDHFVDHMRKMNVDLDNQSSVWSSALELLDIWSEDIEGKRRGDFRFSDSVVICVKYNLRKHVQDLIFGIALFTEDNICVSALHTGIDNIILKPKLGNNEIEIEYSNINLISGTYYFNIGFFEGKAVIPFVYSNSVHKIYIESPFLGEGLLIMEHKWRNH